MSAPPTAKPIVAAPVAQAGDNALARELAQQGKQLLQKVSQDLVLLCQHIRTVQL